MRTCMFGRGAVFLFGAAAAGEKYTDEQKGDFCMKPKRWKRGTRWQNKSCDHPKVGTVHAAECEKRVGLSGCGGRGGRGEGTWDDSDH